MPLAKQRPRTPIPEATHRMKAAAATLPIHEIGDSGLDSETAYELISSELLLDGQARLNLATFVTTYMPSIAARLMADTADKNMIDKDEYPQTAEIEARCVNIISDMWNSPDHEQATGCSTTGSSEAAMLGGLALKWRWRERMRKAGKPTDRPNLVMGANVQVCWEKFCRYWDVEPKLVPMEGNRFHLEAPEAVAACDENTIGVVAILGSTFDGSYEPVKEIAAALDKLEEEKGCYVPVHVDAASGGFVAPCATAGPGVGLPDTARAIDQRVRPQVRTGLPGRGLGDLAQRGRASQGPRVRRQLSRRPHADVRAELLTSRQRGRRAVLHVHDARRAGIPASDAGGTGCGHPSLERDRKDGAVPADQRGAGSPGVRVRAQPGGENYTVFDVSDKLRQHGWLVPAYSFPENRQDLSVLRIVIRAGMTMEMADHLLEHLREITEFLDSLDAPLPGPDTEKRTAFAH